MSQIKIVGAGITGTLVAYFLRNKFKLTTPITILEKSRNGYGRTNSWAMPRVSREERKNYVNLGSVDLGAQHISFETLSEPQREIVNFWTHRGHLRKLDSSEITNAPPKYISGTNYAFENGGSMAVAALLDSIGNCDVLFGESVTKDLISSENNVQWIVTAPTKQAVSLVPMVDSFCNLEKVEYSARICLGIMAKTLPAAISTAGYYYLNEPQMPNVRYIAVTKTTDPDAHCICVHSSVPFGLKHADNDKNVAGKELLAEFENHYGPTDLVGDVVLHKWKYSQVYKSPYQSQNYINTDNITVTGDAFGPTANILGCITAAYETAKFIASKFTS